ncbi:C40 family peptidase [Megasphaera vaginalis (ex Srinivasan et al. 2021)]|uniref:NlpC/P60 family protein n=1 Tax=Megasphaera vaginalis (ex Srinivasan et al. 2021) TaxID=1111454 RepID=U7UER9_9FIRM|nr:NlpC/P60 family protein [Megasphaera vaginalis (ex Srinivasan et al. 2021)]ERT57796.1 NlpC/P60 family protein [Megasphaera vaginalis (ex Srinivasan et al. 2021)]
MTDNVQKMEGRRENSMWQNVSKVAFVAVLLLITTVPVGAYGVGDRGSQVASIQKQLRKFGYAVSADGIYGRETSKAVEHFQADKGLAISGTVDEATYRKLLGKAMPKEKAGKDRKTSRKTDSLPYSGGGDRADYLRTKKSAGNDVIGRKIVSSAYRYLGVPYVFGGNTPSGFDCSGFTRYVFSHNGITLPRMADEQYLVGASVRRRDLVPGDLVFFSTYASGVSHSGIYVGDDNFISATSSGGIRIDSLNSDYWSSRYVGAKRVR